jgi:archaeal flagellar protein FlaI
MENKTILEKYNINSDNVIGNVIIYESDQENVPMYDLKTPEIGSATEALLSELREELVQDMPVDVSGITDASKMQDLKNLVLEKITKKLKEKLPDKNEKNIEIISGMMLHRLYGLGFIEIIMADNYLEEISINGANQPVSVYHKKYGWCKTSIFLNSEEEIYNLSSQIGRKTGRELNNLNPIMDSHLMTGDRVASTLFPISTSGNTITIRRFARNPWTIISLIQNGTLNKEIAAFLWQAIQYELNILVAGGTASGKTSILSAVSSLMPPNQRLISIEDTREIFLPEPLHWNWIPMTTRNKNPEGQGEVTMLDLMISSLRMRPDRIIVGEVRRKDQAETMFEAMHTGHSVYATMHADTVDQVRRRLEEPPIQIPKAEIESLHLILVQYRDRRKGVRRSLELAEILTGGKEEIGINYLYRWIARDDKFEVDNESIRVVEELNLHTGMTPAEIKKDLKEKAQILDWLVKNEISEINQLGSIMKIYYKDPQKILIAAKTNQNPLEFIKKSK